MHYEMIYRGRIDDRYTDFGKYRPAPTTHDLSDALEATLIEKPVARKFTKAIGCYIGDLTPQSEASKPKGGEHVGNG